MATASCWECTELGKHGKRETLGEKIGSSPGGPGKTLSLQLQTVPRDGYRLVRGRLRGSGGWKAAEAPKGRLRRMLRNKEEGWCCGITG